MPQNQTTVKQIPSIQQAEDQYRNASFQLAGYALQHPDKYQELDVTPVFYHGNVRPLAQAIHTANGSQDLLSHIATHHSHLATFAAQAMDAAPLIPGEQALAELRRCYYMLELSRGYADNDLQKIKDVLRKLDQIETESQSSGLQAHTIHDILSRDIPHRDYIFDPIIPAQGLVQLYAPRGVGKTYLALSIGLSVAAGTKLFRWKAPGPQRVTYVDGEMPAITMQERLAAMIDGQGYEPASPEHFRLITPDLQECMMPDLATEAGQRKISPLIKDSSLVILDNLSTLCRTGRENEGEGWLPVQQWLLDLRRQSKSVLIVHHAGKSGQQRGTSRREDVLDTVISMRRPNDYTPDQGARFQVHLDKARGVVGDAAAPFEAELLSDGSSLQWSFKELDDAEKEMVQKLLDDGCSIRDIAEETGFSKSKVGRLKRKIEVGI